MNIRKATKDDQTVLLALMRESFKQIPDGTPQEWAKTKTAIEILLQDPLAGEANLVFEEEDLIGYMIICRGFSLDYGGYFTWLEEAYIQEADQRPFRDKRFSP